MEYFDDRNPLFFKVFLPDHSSQKMRIPDAFLDRILGKIPNRIIMKNSMGKLWPVDVCEIGNGLYFQGGWPRFVLDNSLTMGEFLVFKYNGHHCFDVSIFGINGCERTPVGKEQELVEEVKVEEFEIDEETEEEESEDEIDDKGEESREGMDGEQFLSTENPYFLAKARLGKHHDLMIPKRVMKESHLKFHKSIVLQDLKGREWSAEIRKWKRGQVWVTKGWKRLCLTNKVIEGDNVFCELLPGEKGTCKSIKVHANPNKSVGSEFASLRDL